MVNVQCSTIIKGVAIVIMLLTSPFVFAQDSISTKRRHSTLYGIGVANVLDTYLSPYNYKGVDIRVMRETMRQTKNIGGHIYYQTFIDIDVSYLKSRSKNAHEYAGGIRYSNAWMYKFDKPAVVNLYGGLQPSIYVGGIYHSRNGNNPAQAKVDIMVNATGLAEYNLHIFHKTFPLRYQLTVPLVGLAYSPNYGQSYYEEFVLGHYDHNICFGNFVNMPSMRHLFTIDIPIRNNYLRVGWSGEFNQAKLNGIRYHSYSSNFVIGFTKFFYR